MKSNRLLTTILAIAVLGQAGFAEGKQETGTPADANGFRESGFPIVSQKTTLTAVMSLNPQHGKLEDMAFFKKLEEKTNVRIEWTGIQGANYAEKKNLLLASGDLPDMFYGTAALNDADLIKYSAQGVFLPLNGLIEKYAPNLKKAFARSPAFQKTCTNPEDGVIYSIGRAAERDTQYGRDNMFIYKPWLDKLGLKMPETIDEYTKVLKAFKEKDPNGNGKADEIPFSFVFKDNIYGMHSLFGVFGRVDFFNNGGNTTVTQPGSHFVVDKGKLVYTADKTEYRDAIAYYSRLVQEGLIDQESFVAKDTKTLTAKGNSPDVILGSFMAWDPTLVVSGDRAKDYVPLSPLKGPTGQRVWIRAGNSNGNIGGTGFTLTKKAKYPEIAVRWVDTHFDPLTSAEIFLGPLDINLKTTASGMLEYIPTPAGMSYTEFRLKNAPVHAPSAIFADDWNKVVKLMDEDAYKLSVINNNYKPYMTQSSVYMKFNAAENKFLLSTGKDIDQYVEQMHAKWMLQGGIEQDWQGYVARLAELGLPEYQKTMETAYARWTK